MYAWDYYHAHVFSSALGLTALVPLLRYALHVAVFKPFATWMLATTEQQKRTGTLPQKANHRRKKLTESLWKLTAYSLLLSIGIRAVHDRHWALQTVEWWRGYPDQPFETKVELYYTSELAFYGASMFMLLVWEERRHDFLVMLTHHIVTIFLIAFSYQAGFTRIGSIVMLLHDPSDICLETAKICQYFGFDAAATTFFALLLLSWFVLRLVAFPFWLIRSAISKAWLMPWVLQVADTISLGCVSFPMLLVAEQLFEVNAVLGSYPPYSFAFIVMLCTLVSMHVYWFALIARIAWLKISTGVATDTREDDD